METKEEQPKQETKQNTKQNTEETKKIDTRNLCTECGEDMGFSNPRQLCGKYVCRNLV